MFDDDLFSMFNNNYTATDTEEESSSTSTYSPSSYEQPSQTTYNPYMSDNSYQDDYSTAQNYEEQSSYDSSVRSVEPERTEQRVISQMHTPVIRREQEAVVLTKTKAKIYDFLSKMSCPQIRRFPKGVSKQATPCGTRAAGSICVGSDTVQIWRLDDVQARMGKVDEKQKSEQ